METGCMYQLTFTEGFDITTEWSKHLFVSRQQTCFITRQSTFSHTATRPRTNESEQHVTQSVSHLVSPVSKKVNKLWHLRVNVTTSPCTRLWLYSVEQWVEGVGAGAACRVMAGMQDMSGRCSSVAPCWSVKCPAGPSGCPTVCWHCPAAGPPRHPSGSCWPRWPRPRYSAHRADWDTPRRWFHTCPVDQQKKKDSVCTGV